MSDAGLAPADDAVDRELCRVMSRSAERVLAGDERPYDVAIDAMDALASSDVLEKATHGGEAYVLWADISDLFDDPRGPHSETLCNEFALRAATDWATVDSDSREAVESYFERWNPNAGIEWTKRGR